MSAFYCLVVLCLASIGAGENQTCSGEEIAQEDQSVLLQRSIVANQRSALEVAKESSEVQSLEQQTISNVVYSEDFESLISGNSWCWYTKAWCQDLTVVSDGCMNSHKCLRVAYHPTSRGSERLQQKHALVAGIRTATLSFGVYFERDFEWVKGGKLGAGLFGGQATTGCKPIVPDGWSNRLMWKRDGELILYMYHQKRASACGDYVYAKVGEDKFKFETERWYKLSVSMTLNDPPSADNGDATLYIDDKLAAHVGNIQWRATHGAFIDNMGLSTFYGGSSPSWAPSTTTHVRYDNFQVVTSDLSNPTSAPTPAPTPGPTPAPTPAPTPTPAPKLECAEKWKKCGGKKWEGPTCCVSGLTCVKKNEWFSQCRPS